MSLDHLEKRLTDIAQRRATDKRNILLRDNNLPRDIHVEKGDGTIRLSGRNLKSRYITDGKFRRAFR